MSRKEEVKQAALLYANSIAQHEERKIFCKEDFIAGARWADKTMLDKVCEWLKQNVTYIHPRKGTKECIININAFREAMGE